MRIYPVDVNDLKEAIRIASDVHLGKLEGPDPNKYKFSILDYSNGDVLQLQDTLENRVMFAIKEKFGGEKSVAINMRLSLVEYCSKMPSLQKIGHIKMEDGGCSKISDELLEMLSEIDFNAKYEIKASSILKALKKKGDSK